MVLPNKHALKVKACPAAHVCLLRAEGAQFSVLEPSLSPSALQQMASRWPCPFGGIIFWYLSSFSPNSPDLFHHICFCPPLPGTAAPALRAYSCSLLFPCLRWEKGHLGHRLKTSLSWPFSWKFWFRRLDQVQEVLFLAGDSGDGDLLSEKSESPCPGLLMLLFLSVSTVLPAQECPECLWQGGSQTPSNL
jgi:hypothetical protein